MSANVNELMPLWKHVVELRRHLLISAVALVLASIPAYVFRDYVMAFALAQGQISSLAFIHPVEPFTSYLRLAVSVGFLAILPFIMLQVWRFLIPGLTAREKKTVASASVFGATLFYAGCAFGFFVVSRVALAFLLGVASPDLQAQITVGNYISFVTSLTLLLGLSFQLPLVIVVLVKLGLLSIQTLRARRRHMIVGLWILAAMLTPPDVVSQALLAGPLMLLYELSIVLARLAERRRPTHIGTGNAA